ncbi:hypothetical protein [Amnibacterium kyonggiense]|uniref:Uncharacterized protein n=1 Tax=Amnibacterium kyonggiense TaxID=595671 RepID=A0A4R7FSI7_9MICO|nr:hypothetical protein [Amnibacterium kyonggiense]TDS80835.1 hypothetical protein CLV52_1405 [Amnibacterium kyonggiense]
MGRRRRVTGRRSGLLRSVVTIVLGLSRRHEAPPAAAPWRDRSLPSIDAPMPAVNPLQFGRAFQLPPFGHGNGLEAVFWTPGERLPADRVDATMAALLAEGIAAWAAPVRLPGRDRRATGPHDLWTAADRADDAQDVVMRVLAEH